MTEQDELRDQIVDWLNNETALLEAECEAAGDALVALINGQRCEWKRDEYKDWGTECKAWFSFYHDMEDPFCPSCGKRIEVKDGQG